MNDNPLKSDYYILVGEQQKGPYQLSQMQAMWRSGMINGKTPYWREGLSLWAECSSIARLLGPDVQPATKRSAASTTNKVNLQGFNLVPCKTCGQEIARKAPSCPYCGAPGKRPQTAIGLLAAILIGFILFVFFRPALETLFVSIWRAVNGLI